MKYRKYILLLVSLSILIGCSFSDSHKLKFAETIDLVGVNWKVNENLGKVFDIDVIGDFVALRNDWGETKLTLIDILHRKQVYHFGKRGDGPSELINPGPIISRSNHLDIFDGSKMALLRYDVDSITSGDSLATQILFQTSLSGIISLVDLQDSNYVASGVFQEGRLCLLDKKGTAYAYAGHYPVSKSSVEVPFHVLGVAYQSLMCTQPEGKRTALVTRYGGILQIYEWNLLKKTAKEVCCINEFTPKLTTKDINGTPNFRPDSETRWGYLAVDATDKYIFALYSGRLQEDKNSFHLGNEVHVFDWNGKPCYLLRLDCEGTSLAVKGNKLFVLAEYKNMGNDIVEYNLSLK